MMLKHTVFFIILFSHGFIELINSCSCVGDIPLEKSFADATHVFIGKAIRTAPGTTRNEYRITFLLDKVFKGLIPSNGRIIASTPYESAACGVSIRAGENWQVWATGSDDALQISSCSKTTNETTRNIDFLNKYASPRSPSNLHVSSTSRCQNSLIITITSFFVLIGYHLFSLDK
ncbi:hypothetical protein I4U23_016126 [Adineta vaga]|nr:hypothetical protein I4U23_016126 [Adineta vaga]